MDMTALSNKKTINWSIKVEGEDVTILSENSFMLPALSYDEELMPDVVLATGGTYMVLYPITGRAAIHINHAYIKEVDMPMELTDYLRAVEGNE